MAQKAQYVNIIVVRKLTRNSVKQGYQIRDECFLAYLPIE